ncbi:MAG TPA: hypothetical protein VK966_05140 [Longimicrobiales bacterium]|nr:hypothetical protein [Longimicrobiales bacterium]
MIRTMTALLLTGLTLSAGCGSDSTEEQAQATTMDNTELSEIDAATWKALAQRRIFFGHQSVGRDMMNGMRRVLERHPHIGMAVVGADDPAEVQGPAFIESRIGKNREPGTKKDAFTAVLDGGFGDERGAVAMYKYCYVDMQPHTDPHQLFEDYVGQIETLRERFPGLTIVHFTVPLKTAPTGLKETVKTYLGRSTETALNIKRNRYNQLMRERFAGVDPLFDLALLESTRPDGSRAYSTYRGQKVYMLAPEWTSDGGHLNEEAQVMAAERLLVFLAGLVDVDAGAAELADASGAD